MLTSDNIIVEVRNRAKDRVAQIPLIDIRNLEVILNYNNVGTWTITLGSDNPAAVNLRKRGAGLVISTDAGTIISGNMTSARYEYSEEDPKGIVIITGVDDNQYLMDSLAYPDPTNNAENQTSNKNTRTGSAEKLLKDFVRYNIGPSAIASRKISNLTIETNLDRGPIITKSARYKNLGLLCYEIASTSVLGFKIVQVNDNMIFKVYEPVDRSSDIVWSIENNNITNTNFEFSAPIVTHAIIGGKGAGTTRLIDEYTSSASVSQGLAWGRRIELFVDEKNADTVAELNQAGAEALKGGLMTSNVEVTPKDASSTFMSSWNLGDIIRIKVNEDIEITSIIDSVGILINNEGITIKATVNRNSRITSSTSTRNTNSGNNSVNTSSTTIAGEDGAGVAAGGTSGQLLAKVDNSDYNTEWIDIIDCGDLSVISTIPLINPTQMSISPITNSVYFKNNNDISKLSNSKVLSNIGSLNVNDYDSIILNTREYSMDKVLEVYNLTSDCRILGKENGILGTNGGPQIGYVTDFFEYNSSFYIKCSQLNAAYGNDFITGILKVNFGTNTNSIEPYVDALNPENNSINETIATYTGPEGYNYYDYRYTHPTAFQNMFEGQIIKQVYGIGIVISIISSTEIIVRTSSPCWIDEETGESGSNWANNIFALQPSALSIYLGVLGKWGCESTSSRVGTVTQPLNEAYWNTPVDSLNDSSTFGQIVENNYMIPYFASFKYIDMVNKTITNGDSHSLEIVTRVLTGNIVEGQPKDIYALANGIYSYGYGTKLYKFNTTTDAWDIFAEVDSDEALKDIVWSAQDNCFYTTYKKGFSTLTYDIKRITLSGAIETFLTSGI